MEFKAFKMDGLGNDFVIIDQRYDQFELNNDQIKKICHRNFIGCDQLIFIKKNTLIISSISYKRSKPVLIKIHINLFPIGDFIFLYIDIKNL